MRVAIIQRAPDWISDQEAWFLNFGSEDDRGYVEFTTNVVSLIETYTVVVKFLNQCKRVGIIDKAYKVYDSPEESMYTEI